MSIGIPPLPRPTSGAPEDMRLWASQMVDALHAAFAGIGAPVGSYTVTNLAAADRLLDVSTATTADVAAVLGTLIGDLQTAGVITE